MQRILSTPAQLGTLLSSARAAAGLTQAQAAARVGLSQSRYSQIEADPSALQLAKLLTLLGHLGLELVVQDRDAAVAAAPRGAW